MKRFFNWFFRWLKGKAGRQQMTSRINRISLIPDGYVRKQAGEPFSRGNNEYDPVFLLRREAMFLNLLAGRRAPTLIEEGDDWLIMSNCGNELSTENLPSDWRDQIEEIACVLDEASIIHRDIKPGNILVLNGDLYLIDFGWAISTKEEPNISPRELCSDVPLEHVYDNRAALKWVVSLYES